MHFVCIIEHFLVGILKNALGYSIFIFYPCLIDPNYLLLTSKIKNFSYKGGRFEVTRLYLEVFQL